MLTRNVVAAGHQQLRQHAGQPLPAMAVFLGQVAMDPASGCRQRPVVVGAKVLVGLEISPQLAAELFIVVQPDQYLALFLAAGTDALAVAVQRRSRPPVA